MDVYFWWSVNVVNISTFTDASEKPAASSFREVLERR
jgi:hypothetical protein